MGKLKLVASPTFTAKVGIPVAGDEPVEVLFTFKHRTKSALDEWVASRADKPEAESFMDMVIAWDLEDAFTRENVEVLLENYIGTAISTYRVYLEQLIQAKLKN